MVCSKRDVAVRAFVRILLLLAKSYELVLTVNRVSSAEDLRKAYRKLSLKTHPDKGGKKGDQQKLQQAKEAWEKVLLMRVCRLGWKRENMGAKCVQLLPSISQAPLRFLT